MKGTRMTGVLNWARQKISLKGTALFGVTSATVLSVPKISSALQFAALVTFYLIVIVILWLKVR